MDYEKEKVALIGKLVGFVAEFIESHELTDWCHELPEGGEETIESYLIPKREADDLRAAMKSFLADGVACTEENPCCDRRGEYNGFASGPLTFTCPKHCSCHD